MKNTIIEEEVDKDEEVENKDIEDRTSLEQDASKKKKKQEKDFLEENFFLVIVGGCLAGIFLLIILALILHYLGGKLCKKARVEDDEPHDYLSAAGDRNLSSREKRVLSLILKSAK